MSNSDLPPVSAEAIAAAVHRCSDLVGELLEESSDPERALFILLGAVQLLHVASPADGRALIENRMRLLLAELYQAPSAELVKKQGLEFVIGEGPHPTVKLIRR